MTEIDKLKKAIRNRLIGNQLSRSVQISIMDDIEKIEKAIRDDVVTDACDIGDECGIG